MNKKGKFLVVTLFIVFMAIKPIPVLCETIWYKDMNLHLLFTLDPTTMEAVVGTDEYTDYSNAKLNPPLEDPWWESYPQENFWHDIVIPSKVLYGGKEYTVTKIGPSAFYTCLDLYTITLPETIREIGKYAFHYCINLESINIPEGVGNIGKYTFDLCKTLTSVHLPSTIRSIGEHAFSDCYELKEINIPGSCTLIDNEAFTWCRSLEKVVIEDGTGTLECGYTQALGLEYQGIDEPKKRGIFADCPIKDLYIGRNLSYPQIGDKIYNPFYCISNYGRNTSGYQGQIGKTIEKVAFGENVTDIPDELFLYSFIKNEIVLPPRLKSIGARAFSNINYSDGSGTLNQYKIDLPETLERMGGSCFGNSGVRIIYCKSVIPPILEVSIGSFTVFVPENSGEYYREDSYWQSAIIIDPADKVLSINVKTAGSLYDRLIAQDMQLRDVVRLKLRGNLNDLDWNIVREMSKMYELDLSELALDTIPSGLFSGLNVSTLMLPNTINMIPESAFSDCIHLTGIFHIPSSCTLIGDNAFRKTSIEGLDYEGSLTIGREAFSRCMLLKEVEIKGDYTHVGESAFSGSGLKNVIIEKGVELDDDAFSFNYNLTNVIIRDSVRSIGNRAFEYCKALEKVVFEGRVDEIGEDIFKLCDSLSEVHITNASWWCQLPFPESSAPLKYGAKLFLNGKTLKDVVLSDDVLEIGSYSFYGCDSIESVILSRGLRNIKQYSFYGCHNIAEVNFPSSLRSIGSYAFAKCNKIVSLDIPTSVESIGTYAFQNCSMIEKVVAHWKEPITIDGYTTFYGINNGCYLYIPIGTASKYSAAGWSLPNLKAAGILSISGNIGGSIYCYDETITNKREDIFFNPYQSFNISFIAEDGYHLKKVRMNGVDVTGTLDNNILFIEEPDEDFTVSVVFADDNIAMGDVNGDGGIDSQDVLAVANFILKIPPESFYDYAADMNDDEVINITDAIIIESMFNE